MADFVRGGHTVAAGNKQLDLNHGGERIRPGRAVVLLGNPILKEVRIA
jgi:hypothetical protein